MIGAKKAIQAMANVFKPKPKKPIEYHLISTCGDTGFIKARVVFSGNKYVIFRSDTGKEYSRRIAKVKIKPLPNQ